MRFAYCALRGMGWGLMENLLTEIELLQNLLIDRATGGNNEQDNEYKRLRKLFLGQSELVSLVPQCVHTTISLAQFWTFIKPKYNNYQERRAYLYEAFQPIINRIEFGNSTSPSDNLVSNIIKKLDSSYIQAEWEKALKRRLTDPEAAITTARTLIEATCKHILDEAKVSYGENSDLPQLYRLTSECLNISPSQHTEKIFKQILGGCTSIIEGLGALRNRLSDAHGKGKFGARPAERHAELAVNLAGAVSMFMIATHSNRKTHNP
jgi:hypothetical protein